MFKTLIISSCIIFSSVILLMYLFQRNLIYYPLQQAPQRHDFDAHDMTVITLQTQDQVTLNSWYKPAMSNQPTIVYLHGNAGHIGYRMPMARQLIDAGFGVFLLEYRGFSGNKGYPTENGLYEDGRTALRFLNQHGVTSQKIVLYGESLGTGVATQLAVENQVCALILQSPFTSLDDLAHYHYPWLFIKPWDKYNSLEKIKSIHAPLLVLHGVLDQIVPYSEGVALFNAANEPKKMTSFEQHDHNNLWSAPNFYKDVLHFIQRNCGAHE